MKQANAKPAAATLAAATAVAYCPCGCEVEGTVTQAEFDMHAHGVGGCDDCPDFDPAEGRERVACAYRVAERIRAYLAQERVQCAEDTAVWPLRYPLPPRCHTACPFPLGGYCHRMANIYHRNGLTVPRDE